MPNPSPTSPLETTPTPDTPQTVLGESARVRGDLHLDRAAVLAGTVTGSVHAAGPVELTATAIVEGDVHALSLKLAGRVGGDVVTTQTTELLPGGTIGGRLNTGHLITPTHGITSEPRTTHAPASRGETAPDHATAKAADRQDRSAIQLNRASGQAKKPPQSHPFTEVPGTVNAALRPRRRTPA